MKHFICTTVLFLALFAFVGLVSLHADTDVDDTIKVLTINVRLSTANDGENAWAKRRDFMMEVVRNAPDGNGPYDFVGMQETVVHPDPELNQVNFAIKKMPEYGSIYLSREKTPERGEAMLILWKKDRWEIDEKDQGTFWLSDTPEIAGSKTDPKAGCPRIVTFGLFHEIVEKNRTGKKVYVYNTHYDHMSEEARKRGAKLLLERVSARKDMESPVIVMGDLNSGEKSDAIRFMQGEKMVLDDREVEPAIALTDSFRAVNPDAVEVGSFNSFKKRGKDKIDYIFITDPLKAVSSKIILTTRDGRFPTDHFPVEAVLRF